MNYVFLFLIPLMLNSCKENKQVPVKPISMAEKEIDSMDNQLVGNDTAYLGGGCFWCMEAVYSELNGIVSVESGYSGGKKENPTYSEVCSGSTGHAEIIKVVFDSRIISYQDVVDIFWHVHNPTTLNRQGNDQGTQYRSVIFYENEKQKEIAQKSLQSAEQEKVWPDPFVTEIVPLVKFYKAENYHQSYFENNPNQSYCVYVVSPKVEKFRKEYKEKLKQP